MRYYYLIKVTPNEKHILLTFLAFNCSFFPLLTVKRFEMWADYANTGTETLSPFVASSVDNVLLQTNPDFTSRFLNSSTFLNVTGRLTAVEATDR